MKVKCDACNLVMNINNVPVYDKLIEITCRGEYCNNKIQFRTPKQQATTSTETSKNPGKLLKNGPSITIDNNEDSIEYFLNLGVNVIGRKDYDKHPDISLNVLDSSLSRLHCMIEGVTDETKCNHFIIQDYKSKNGVYLNGRKLSEYDQVYLENNDEIYLSKTRLIFKDKISKQV